MKDTYHTMVDTIAREMYALIDRAGDGEDDLDRLQTALLAQFLSDFEWDVWQTVDNINRGL
jgi:hypothetical protein